MGFSEKQLLVLATAWKQGHLSDNKNYGTISEVTGLSRKQVSNWARNQIHKNGSKPLSRKQVSNWARNQIHKNGSKPLPKKNSNDLLSIHNALPERMRTDKDYLTFLAPKLASVLSAKREKIEPTGANARLFTAQQRKVLITAWERGFLCDHKNYVNLSEITGLTRKQISNWARAKINKNQGNLPPKNSAPLSTIFTELSLSLEERDPHQDEKVEHVEVASEWQKHQRVKKETELMPLLTPLELPLLPARPIPLAMSSIEPKESDHIVHPPGVDQKLTLSNLPSREYGASDSVAPHFSYDPHRLNVKGFPSGNMVPNTALFLRDIQNWILQRALKGVNEVDDKRVEALSLVVCIADFEIIFYLLNHGWYPRPANKGMRYVRIRSTAV